MKKKKLYYLSLSVYLIIVAATMIVLWYGKTTERKNCLAYQETTIISIARTMASQIDRTLIDKLKKTNRTNSKYSHQEAIMELKYQLNRVREINQLQKATISILFYDAIDKELKVLASSDAIYKFKEKYYDRSGQVLQNYGIGGSNIIKINEKLDKAVAFAPIHNLKNEVLGVIMIDRSINDYLSVLDNLFIRNFGIALLFLAFLGIAFFKVSRQINKRFNVLRLDKIHLKSKLNDKNLELELLKSVSQKSDDLILISNTNGKVLWINQTSQSNCGFSSDELETLKGKNIKDVIPNDNISNVILNLVKFKQPVNFIFEKIDALKTQVKYNVKVKPEMNEQLEIAHLIFTIQNALQGTNDSVDLIRKQDSNPEISTLSNPTESFNI